MRELSHRNLVSTTPKQMPSIAKVIMSRYRSACVLVLLLACRSHASELHSLYGPIFVDQAGVDLISADPIEIEGDRNLIAITIPANLHPDYNLLKVVDSTNSSSTEFFADVQLGDGHVFTFSAQHRLSGVPSYPERVIELLPDEGVELAGKVVRIRLRSTRPSVVPKIEWKSWSQGI